MSAGKEAELMTAALLYAVRCFAEGDLNALKEMNFGPKELGALREISMSDLFRVRALTAHCLQFRLNREIYWSMLDHLRRERDCRPGERSSDRPRRGRHHDAVAPGYLQRLDGQSRLADCCVVNGAHPRRSGRRRAVDLRGRRHLRVLWGRRIRLHSGNRPSVGAGRPHSAFSSLEDRRSVGDSGAVPGQTGGRAAPA